MHFQYPQLLWFLLLLLIPIVIHFFNFRRFRSVTFTNVAFLKNIKSETRKSSVIRKRIVLTLRMLCLASLVLAFAVPYRGVPQKTTSKPQTVFFLDNSFSMQAKGPKGELFKRAIQDLMAYLPENQNFKLFTNTQTFSSISEKALQKELANPQYCSIALHWKDVINKGKSLFSPEKTKKNLVLITDLQGFPNSMEKDSSYTLFVIPQIPVSEKNISVRRLFLENTEKNKVLRVQLTDNDKTSKTVIVSLKNGDSLVSKTLAPFDQGKADIAFTLPEGNITKGLVSVTDSNMPFDNDLFFSINPKNKVNVLSVNEVADDGFLRRIFFESEFTYISKSLNDLNYAGIEQQDLLVLNGLKSIPPPLRDAVKAYVRHGGHVLVIPSQDMDIPSYNKVLEEDIHIKARRVSEKSITKIVFSDALYKNVFEQEITNFEYPKTKVFYETSHKNKARVALYFEDGKPCLLANGTVSFFAMPLATDYTDFLKSPLIVPTLYNIARQSGRIPPLYYIIGQKSVISVPVNNANYNEILELGTKNYSFIPLQKHLSNKIELTTETEPAIAGSYQIKGKSDTYGYVSYNFDRKESPLKKRMAIDGVTSLQSIPDFLTDFKAPENASSWKWFVVFALLMIVTEGLMLKQKT